MPFRCCGQDVPAGTFCSKCGADANLMALVSAGAVRWTPWSPAPPFDLANYVLVRGLAENPCTTQAEAGNIAGKSSGGETARPPT
jgi:hypothetical protein